MRSDGGAILRKSVPGVVSHTVCLCVLPLLIMVVQIALPLPAAGETRVFSDEDLSGYPEAGSGVDERLLAQKEADMKAWEKERKTINAASQEANAQSGQEKKKRAIGTGVSSACSTKAPRAARASSAAKAVQMGKAAGSGKMAASGKIVSGTCLPRK